MVILGSVLLTVLLAKPAAAEIACDGLGAGIDRSDEYTTFAIDSAVVNSPITQDLHPICLTLNSELPYHTQYDVTITVDGVVIESFRTPDRQWDWSAEVGPVDATVAGGLTTGVTHTLTVAVTRSGGVPPLDPIEVDFIVQPASAHAVTRGLGESPDAGYAFDEYRVSDRAIARVNRTTGNLFLREVDVNRTNTDFEYDVTRSYNSQKTDFGRPGVLVQRGWTHDLGVNDLLAKEYPNGDVDVSLPGGTELAFTKAPNRYVPPPYSNARLRLDGATFVLEDIASEDELRFPRATSGTPRFSTLATLGDGAFDLTRSGDAQVTDSLGRVIDFTYVPGTKWATSAAGVQFGYDVAAAPGNWPTQLRSALAADSAWESRYTYDSANRLASIATGGGELRIVYDAHTRVTRVTEVATGVPDKVTTYTYPQGEGRVVKVDSSGRTSTAWFAAEYGFAGSHQGSSPPVVDLSGNLFGYRWYPLAPDTAYPLVIDSADPDGVALVELLVDGDDERAWEPDCPTSCAETQHTYTMDTADWEAGWHTIRATVTDRLGAERTTQFRVEIPETAIDEVPVPDDTIPGPDADTPLTGEDCDAYFGPNSPYCAPDPLELNPFAPTGRLIYGIAEPDTRVIDDGTPERVNGELVSYLNDPLFQALKVKRVRALLPWNLMHYDGRIAAFARFYRLAVDRGMQITVSFQFGCQGDLPTTGSGTLSCYGVPANHNTAPKAAAWVSAMRAFKKRFKKVRYISAWNEPNEGRQPTRAGITGPKRAAKYTYLLEKHVCSLAPEGNPCDVLAAELAPGGSSVRYLRRYRRELVELHQDGLPRTRLPEYWAYHPYGDVNHRYKKRQRTKTYKVMRQLPAGAKLWFLEVGSRVDSGDNAGDPRNSAAGQAREVRYLTNTLAPWFDRVTRVYYYQFCRPTVGGSDVWDSGLLVPPATAGEVWCSGPRDAYDAYKQATLQNPNG